MDYGLRGMRLVLCIYSVYKVYYVDVYVCKCYVCMNVCTNNADNITWLLSSLSLHPPSFLVCSLRSHVEM